MDILGIGPLELFFVLLIALIVFGPNDLVKAGRTMGEFLRKIVSSPSWHIIQQTSQDLRHLPNRLMREAGLENLDKELPQISPVSTQYKEIKETKKKEEAESIEEGISAWTTPPNSDDESNEISIPPEEEEGPPTIDNPSEKDDQS